MGLTILPNSGQSLNDTRDAIRGNFSSIDTQFAVDHVAWNAVGAGKHNKVSFPVQSPTPIFLAGEQGLYNANYGTTTKNELWVHKVEQQNGTIDVPFTASILSNTSYAGAVNGWSYLPSGIHIKWGIQLAGGSLVGVTPLATSGGPSFNQVFRAFVIPYDTSGHTNFNCGVKTNPVANSGNFDAYCANASGTTSIIYLVIGV